jgi:hypothetical protein
MSRLKKKISRHRWTDDEKQQLIRDVKQAWIEGNTHRDYLRARGVNATWFHNMQTKYLAEHPDFDPAPRKNGWPLDPEERKLEVARRKANRTPNPTLDPAVVAALAEYRGLRMAEKRTWREAHNLTHDQLSKIRHGRATPAIVARMLNGNQPQATVRDLRLARVPEPVPVTMLPNSAPPVASAPVTLDDAILAFHVYQDHLKEFVDRLVRMRGGR